MIHKIRWTIEKITQRLELIEPLVYRRRHPIASFRYLPLPGPHEEPPVGVEVEDGTWQRIEPPAYWGEWRQDFVLRSEFQVPAEWEEELPVALYLPLGRAGDFTHPDSLAYIDGVPYAACDREHQEILLPPHWRDGNPHLLALHGWCGIGGRKVAVPGSRLLMQPCAVVQIDPPTRDFIATARVALQVVGTLDEDQPARGRLLNALDEAFLALDTREPFGDRFYESVLPAHALLREGIERAGPPLDVDLLATGHAHIDVAWLWTLGQTRRKAGRTFYNVIRLMEQFPDFHFTQSQPQLYDYVRQDYPELFEAIRARVEEGRWEATGGMWVEADCNITGPESLARQFLLGRTFFREHFGPDAESPVLWLPDVFGYAWSLPQLIKQAGLEYFMTIKIGWNQYSRLPYDSFWWQGLDGSRVLTHFITTPDDEGINTASTYNAKAFPAQIIGTWTNLQQKEIQNELLMAFGWGDGGGGPTRLMLENIRELASFPAAPRVRQGAAASFFERLERESGPLLPTWNGELYLELHRGTYTTQSRNKRANRKSEFLLHDAEFLAALAAHLSPDYSYPADTLRRAWELVCLNQFHDIIPGSSIGEVYAESLQQYEEVQARGVDVRQSALAAVADRVGGEWLVVNPTSFSRQELAFLPAPLPAGHHLEDGAGRALPVQPAPGGCWIEVGPLAPYSVTALHLVAGPAPRQESALRATPTLLENEFLRVELNEQGDITRLYDRQAERELLPPGAIANQFQAFEDRPLDWDAWDVDIFFEDRMWTSDPATSVEVIEQGPLRATLEIRRRILHSDYVQRISLARDRAQLDFETTIEWRERHVLLKVAFPVEILAPVATYEIQWGNAQRPTHRNTAWDWARFETCAQKWVDLSEGNYGVSLLNDCKYGHDIRDNVMRISLLRSPTYPDPEADQGRHHFTYSLLPHAGDWRTGTVPASYALNDPLIVARGPGGPPKELLPPLVALDVPNAIIETVKQAEDGNGLIVRLYEHHRSRGAVTVRTGFPLAAAYRCNLLEENEQAVEVGANELRLPLRPFEIVTLRLVPAEEERPALPGRATIPHEGS